MADIGDAVGLDAEASAAMRRVLNALKHPGLIKAPPTVMVYVVGIGFGSITLAPLPVLIMYSEYFGFQWDWLTSLLLGITVIGIAIVVLVIRAMLRKIHRFRLGIRHRLDQSDLLERIAQGPGGLPDIHEYTAFPWRLMLGTRPNTLPRSLQVVAYNIEWYLLPEPKPYIKQEWKSFAMMLCLIPLIAMLLISLLVWHDSSNHVPGHTANIILSQGLMYCLLLPPYVALWHLVYQFACMLISRQALSDIIRERYGLQ